MMSRQVRGSEMLQKSPTGPVFSTTSSMVSKSQSGNVSDMSETDFEDDTSDFDEYAGRRSEDSVSIIILLESLHFLNVMLSMANGATLQYQRTKN